MLFTPLILSTLILPAIAVETEGTFCELYYAPNQPCPGQPTRRECFGTMPSKTDCATVWQSAVVSQGHLESCTEVTGFDQCCSKGYPHFPAGSATLYQCVDPNMDEYRWRSETQPGLTFILVGVVAGVILACAFSYLVCTLHRRRSQRERWIGPSIERNTLETAAAHAGEPDIPNWPSTPGDPLRLERVYRETDEGLARLRSLPAYSTPEIEKAGNKGRMRAITLAEDSGGVKAGKRKKASQGLQSFFRNPILRPRAPATSVAEVELQSMDTTKSRRSKSGSPRQLRAMRGNGSGNLSGRGRGTPRSSGRERAPFVHTPPPLPPPAQSPTTPVRSPKDWYPQALQ